jgi:predicted site-specific integrase-resolvase
MKHAQDEWYFQSEPLARERPITSRQLADHLQVTMRCLANWRKTGRIPFMRLTARCLRYELGAVREALGMAEPNE